MATTVNNLYSDMYSYKITIRARKAKALIHDVRKHILYCMWEGNNNLWLRTVGEDKWLEKYFQKKEIKYAKVKYNKHKDECPTVIKYWDFFQHAFATFFQIYLQEDEQLVDNVCERLIHMLSSIGMIMGNDESEINMITKVLIRRTKMAGRYLEHKDHKVEKMFKELL